jgi:hypothetical protein
MADRPGTPIYKDTGCAVAHPGGMLYRPGLAEVTGGGDAERGGESKPLGGAGRFDGPLSKRAQRISGAGRAGRGIRRGMTRTRAGVSFGATLPGGAGCALNWRGLGVGRNPAPAFRRGGAGWPDARRAVGQGGGWQLGRASGGAGVVRHPPPRDGIDASESPCFL